MTLSFSEYQKQARGTAIYPNQNSINGLMYTALGLAGEAGETADQTKKVLRDDNGQLTPIRLDKLKKELGDTLWYLANMAEELGMSLEEIAQHNLDKLHDRQDRGVLQGDGGLR